MGMEVYRYNVNVIKLCSQNMADIFINFICTGINIYLYRSTR